MAASAAETRRTVHVRIEGRVQGVGYRAWVAATATALRLDGWVRNRRGGTVEAVFGGPADAVADMLKRCDRGPAAARVSQVIVIAEGLSVDSGFDVLGTI